MRLAYTEDRTLEREMSYVDTTECYRQGYAVVPVLTPDEAARYASIADEWVASGSPGDFITIPEIPQVLGHPAVQDAIRQILGTTELILETWKLMAIDRGDTYRQGWHRDIPLGATWLPDETADQLLAAIATAPPRAWRGSEAPRAPPLPGAWRPTGTEPTPCRWTDSVMLLVGVPLAVHCRMAA